METVTITVTESHWEDELIRRAGRAIAAGELVVFPTETVYGLAASAVHAGAIDAMSRLKQRTADKPFTLHLAEPAEAAAYAGHLPVVAQRIIRKVWPGPLTLVVPDRRKKPGLPEGLIEEAVYHAGTVGLRCPSHAIGRAILKAAGVPVAATSANLAGRNPPRTAAEALAHLKGLVPLVVDSGPTQFSSASSVVRVGADDSWEVLREGAVTTRRVERLARTRILIICTGNMCRSPMAAGLARQMLAERLGCRPDLLRVHGLEVASAGTAAFGGSAASDNAVEVLEERGIDLTKHRSQPVTVDALLAADYIWVMTRSHLEWVVRQAPEVASRVSLLDPLGRDVPDPVGGTLEAYRACARHLEEALAEKLMEIV